MINNEINGIFFDLNLDKQIWLFVDETNISKMFINSDETFDVLMQTLKNMETDDLKFSERRSTASALSAWIRKRAIFTMRSSISSMRANISSSRSVTRSPSPRK